MSDKKRVAEDNAGVFLADRGVVVVPIHGLNVGPGKPGPEDAWQVPMGPVETEHDAPNEAEPNVDRVPDGSRSAGG